MARLRVLGENPPPPRGNGENQLRELRDYITRLKDELEFLLTHLGSDNLDGELTDTIEQVDTQAGEITDLQRRGNPNLLLNWHFANPINQRGKTSYTAQGPNIDAWANDNSHTIITVGNDYLTLESNSASYAGILLQRCPVSSAVLVGAAMTFSAVYRGRLRFNASIGSTIRSSYYESEDWDVASWTMTMPSAAGADYLEFWINIDGGAEVNHADIMAVKAEFGTMQTLARIESGSVIINDPISCDTELVKCRLNSKATGDDLAGLGMATIAMIAPTEKSNAASRAYTVGKYFCWHGLLYKATAAISVNDQISPGTGADDNCLQTTVMEEI